MITGLLLAVAGLAVLTLGGEAMIRGAVSVALMARISQAVVGLTVVAFATSVPELAVSMTAALRGSTVIAYANVVGSNIFNMAVILAVAALIRPVPANRDTLRFEFPVMFAALFLAVSLASNGIVSRADGALLVTALAAFLIFTVKRTTKEPSPDAEYPPEGITARTPGRAWALAILLVLLGIAGLTAGASMLVQGAVTIARIWGVSERVIGLTVIAMGTSLPELVASATAARRGHTEIALSNLIGSNIFNVLAILGITGSILPVPVPDRALSLDNWVMVASSVVVFPVVLRYGAVSRWHGVLLLSGFAAYMVVLLSFG